MYIEHNHTLRLVLTESMSYPLLISVQFSHGSNFVQIGKPMEQMHADACKLLSRSAFRNGVLARRDGRCCVPECPSVAVDAHHIIERRLWIQPEELGGYFLENGAAVCEKHHLDTERTVLTPNELREYCSIEKAVLPGEFYLDSEMSYTKWGDIVLPDGGRLPGPLFWGESVQKILSTGLGVLESYRERVKYPRTMHLPWSPGRTKDDRVLSSVAHWIGEELVVTEKMDGENTTVYSDGYIHARSVDSGNHHSRNRLRADIQRWAYELPQGWRVCGENLTAVHSIKYEQLPDRFLLFSIWDGNRCLSWDETVEWAELLGLQTPRVIWRGNIDSAEQLQAVLTEEWKQIGGGERSEGYVSRLSSDFELRDFHRAVGKFVRSNHVTSAQHWMRRSYEENTILK